MFCSLGFWNCILFVIWCLIFGIFSSAYALNLDKPKASLLEGDYKAAILEGEKLVAQDAHSDELYYILGIAYLKDGNLLRASDIFEIILKEFKNSNFKDEARLGLGDTYFLRGDFSRAQDCYEGLINSHPETKLKAQVYYRLSQLAYKKGDAQQGKEYLDKLKDAYPLNLESSLNKDLCLLSGPSAGLYYTIQVGAFSNITNANNLTNKLIQKGYPAYMDEAGSQGKISYRVRVGKFKARDEALNLEKKLSQEGYPTKICP
jgi:tetratricopeptide (TPR) repeat protein